MRLACLLCLASAAALQATVIYQTGFEQPTYSPGQLVGQGGWSASTIGTVENTVALQGVQAVQMNATGTSGQNLDGHSLTYTAVANPEYTVVFDVDFMQSAGGTSSNWSTLALFGNSGFITQAVVNSNGTTHLGTGHPAEASFTRGVWNHFEVVLNFSTQMAFGYFNGSFLGSNPFESAGNTGMSEVDFGINNTPGTDSGFFDNLSVVSTVPEPSSFATLLMGLGLVLAAAQQRARR